MISRLQQAENCEPALKDSLPVNFFFPPSGVFLSVQRFEDVNFYSFYIFFISVQAVFFLLVFNELQANPQITILL